MVEETERGSQPSTDSAAIHTFLIADLRGYTRFTLERGDDAGAALTERFASIAREVVSARSGRVVELRGDEALAVFVSARQALHAAVELQEHCARATVLEPDMPLKVGIGLDAGEAIPVEGGFRGTALNLAARLCSLAGMDEVLASEGVIHLARKVPGLIYLERGSVELKGFADPIRVVEVRSVPLDGDLGESEYAGARLTVAEPGDGTERPLPIGGFLGALPTGALVARDDELRRLLSTVDAVAGGSGRVVMLAGEPGVGKTRLAQEVMLSMRNRDFMVAVGRCYEPQHTVPYFPLLEALATAFGAAPSPVRADIPRRWPYLARLLPDQLGRLAATFTDEEEQQRLFRAVTGFLLAISQTAPVALMLDDLHWADSATLELLQHLARQTRAHPVLVLGTYRDTEVERGHPLRQALVNLHREQLLEQLTVRPLNRSGTAVLMATSFGQTETSDEFSALIHRHTDGNPFFIGEVLRALVERGNVYRRQGAWARKDIEEIEVPQSIRSAIEERVAHLSEGAQTILHEASVLGQTFSFADLQALASHPEPALEAALDSAAGAGLLREIERDAYSFNHVLTQQALYADLPARRKRKLHLAAADAMERLPEKVRERKSADLAWHFLEGGDERRALTYALLAGDQARAVSAHAQAEEFYRTALRLVHGAEQADPTLAGIASAALRAEILWKLGVTLRMLARYGEALPALEEAAMLYDSIGDVEGKLGVTSQIGYVHHVAGTWQRGIARIESALASLSQDAERETVPSREEASLCIPLALLYMKDGKYDASLTVLDRAAALARELRQDQLLLQAEVVRGDALRLLGRPAEALQVLEDSVVLTESLVDNDSLFVALDSLAELYMLGGDLELSRKRRERAVEAAEHTGDPAKVTFEVTSFGFALFYLGKWDEAVSQFERALELARSLDRPEARALFGLGMVALSRGDLDRARACLDEGISTSAAGQTLETLSVGHAAYAELEILEGRPDAARSRLETTLQQSGLSEPAISALLPVLAWAQVEIGSGDEAEGAVGRALEQASKQQNRLAQVEAMRVQGMLLGRRSQWADAAEVLIEALSLARAMPSPHSVARILLEHGEIDLRRERPQEAVPRLQEALDVCIRLGARREAERAKSALGRNVDVHQIL